MTQTITLAQLRQMLASSRGAHFVTFTARTSARARKTGNRHWPVTKLARVNGVIGFNYGLTVRRQQLREGRRPTFKPDDRTWGNRADPPPAATPGKALSAGRKNRRRGLCPLYCHKGRDYLDVKVERVLQSRYFDAAGRELQLRQVEKFLPKRKSAAAHQGVRRQIVLRDYHLESIESISIGGAVYEIRA
jgi:hypothetical protein